MNNIWPDVVGFIGSLLLVVPAFRADSILKKLKKIGSFDFTDATLEKLRKTVKESMEDGLSRWNIVDTVCLRLGISFIAISYFLNISAKL